MALVIEQEKEVGHLKIGPYFGFGFLRSRGEITCVRDCLGKIPVITKRKNQE